jgi:fructokinase
VRVIGIGEILWDELPSGRAIGGAPFNVVAHLARLEHKANYVTAVGSDEPGRAAIAEVRARGVSTSLIQVTEAAPTGIARVQTDALGSVRFEIVRPAAFEEIRLDGAALRRIARQQPGVVVFGTLAQCQSRALDATAQVCAAAAPGSLRLYDVNLRSGWWGPGLIIELTRLASVVKLAEEEARELSPVFGLAWHGARSFCRAMAERAGLRCVAVSAGASSAHLWLDGELAQARPPAITVADTVGAGDAFSAGLLDAMSQGLPAAAALRHANALGALIASRQGAQPTWAPADLTRLENA